MCIRDRIKLYQEGFWSGDLSGEKFLSLSDEEQCSNRSVCNYEQIGKEFQKEHGGVLSYMTGVDNAVFGSSEDFLGQYNSLSV